MPQVQGLGETTRAPAPRHIFAVVCCVRSTKVQTSLNETSLYRTLYPTLRDTVTPRERKLWRVRLYLCADDNDQLFQQHAAQVAADSPPGLETRLLFIPARSNRVPSREAAEQARLDGAEYFHRTNDDISYMSIGWITARCARSAGSSRPTSAWPGPRSAYSYSSTPTHLHTDFSNQLLLTRVLNTNLLTYKPYPRTYLRTYQRTSYSHILGPLTEDLRRPQQQSAADHS